LKLITIERFFSSRFSQDFRIEISCFVPILHKIPVEWTNQNYKKGHKNHHHDPSPSTRFCWPKHSIIIAIHFQHVNQDLLVTVL
jgi:hypothetical protein